MGTWNDQWWRVRDAVTLPRVAAVMAVVLLLTGGYQLTRVDWASYGPAEPPIQPETIDSSLVTLRSVRIGDFEALEETPSFTWSQFVTVKIEADCSANHFHVYDPKRKWGEPLKHPERYRSSLGLEFVRRSSLGDGSVVAYTCASGARVNKDDEMTWSDETWIPNVPGKYRVRVVLYNRNQPNNVPHRFPPIVIGTFDLKVEPGEPAA